MIWQSSNFEKLLITAMKLQFWNVALEKKIEGHNNFTLNLLPKEIIKRDIYSRCVFKMIYKHDVLLPQRLDGWKYK